MSKTDWNKLLENSDFNIDLVLPVSKKKVKLRKWKMKAKKEFLLYVNDENFKDAVKILIKNQIISPQNLDLNKLSYIDIGYMLIMLKKYSSGDKIELNEIKCNKCNALNDYEFDIEKDLIIENPKYINNMFTLTENLKILIKPLTVDDIFSIYKLNNDIEYPFEVISRFIDAIGINNELKKNLTLNDKKDFLYNLPEDLFYKLSNIIPDVFGKISLYKKVNCIKCGNEMELSLGFLDFFIL